MAIFGRKKVDEEYDEEELEEFEKDISRKKFRDLKPEYRKRRKEPPKPWGKKERYTVLVFLLATVFISALLSTSSRGWKLPGLPKIRKLNFDFLSGETITIGPGRRAVDVAEVEKAEKIKREFDEKTKNLSGIYAFFVVDLTSGYSFGENENDVFTAASLIKLPVSATLYVEAEAGNINLDERPGGSSLTFRQLAEEMGKKSSNEAQLMAVKALGQERIKKAISEIGMTRTVLVSNETTAYDIGLFFQKLWNNQIVSQKSRDEILGYLTDTIYEDWLPAGIPNDIRVAHKYGRETHVVNDAGIVYSEKPFVLVIMTKGIIEKEADAAIPEISRIVYQRMAL